MRSNKDRLRFLVRQFGVRLRVKALKKAEFARLCGVSGAMVTKYVREKRLVIDANGGIDARQSLMNLAGIMAGDRHSAAWESLTGEKWERRAAETPELLSTDEQIKRVRLERERLTYARAAGELVSTRLVTRRAQDAVSRLQQALDQTRHATADTILDQLGADPAHRPAILRILRAGIAESMRRYAADMAALAEVDDDAALPAELQGADGAEPTGVAA